MRAVNLIPAEQRDRASGLANRSNGVAYAVPVGLALVGGLAALYGVASHEAAEKEREAKQLEGQARTAQAQASGLAAYRSFLALRSAREGEILSLINSRFDWARLLAGLGQELPAGASVSSFQGTVGVPNATATASANKGGSVTSATPPGSVPTVTLVGCLPNGSQLPTLLTRLRLIEGVKAVELHTANTGQGSATATTSGCGANSLSYNLTLVFQPLPTPPTVARRVVVAGESSGAGQTPAALKEGKR